MIDPLTLTTAISAASAAYGQVKKLVQAGREFEEISESLGKWMGAVSDIDNINKNSNNPSTFDKLFNGSIEEVALKSYSAKLQIQKHDITIRPTFNNEPILSDSSFKSIEGKIDKKTLNRKKMFFNKKEKEKLKKLQKLVKECKKINREFYQLYSIK